MHQERDVDAGCLRGGKRLMPVDVRGNQAVAIHNNPLVRISGAIFLNPVHFTPSIAGRDHSASRFLLETVRESQHLLLLRRWQAADSQTS